MEEEWNGRGRNAAISAGGVEMSKTKYVCETASVSQPRVMLMHAACEYRRGGGAK